MKKHLAEAATLSGIDLNKSNFEICIDDVKEGSSLGVSIEIDHEFKDDEGTSSFICKYSTKVEGLDPNNEKIFTLFVEFWAQYSLDKKEDWAEDDINTFVDKCVNFHVWPYMREHVHNLSSKANIPSVLLPLLPSAHTSKAVCE